jgi:flagellar biosynthetic protein FliR
VSPAGIALIAQQVLIGLGMGFVLRLAFGALDVAGQVIATQMGLSYATMVDPQNGAQVPLVGHFFQITGTLVFLALNGHLLLLQLLAESFQQLPVGMIGIGREALWRVAGWATHLFAGAVLVALPAIASLMVVNLAFAVMTRAAPQLNIFAVGIPITLLLGLLILLYGLPSLLPQLERLLDGALQSSRALLP